MMDLMRLVLATPAFWGLCGGLLSGLHGLVTAYSAKAGTPEARRRAWLRLAFGIPAGMIVAEAVTVRMVLKLMPTLDSVFVALVIGWMTANDPKAVMSMLSRVIRAVFNQEPKP